MAKDTITLEVNPDDLGVLAQHDLRMQTDAEYRNRALTPPGGLAPGEGDKPEDKPSGDVPKTAGILAAATVK